MYRTLAGYVLGKNDHIFKLNTKGVFCCTVCGGVKTGAITRECSGKKMSFEQYVQVCTGTLDFYHGHWREVANSVEAYIHLDNARSAHADGTTRSLEIEKILAESVYHMDKSLGCIAKQPLIPENWVPAA